MHVKSELIKKEKIAAFKWQEINRIIILKDLLFLCPKS